MLSSLGLGKDSPYIQSGYNDSQAVGISTPSGYGRKSKAAAIPITSMMVPVTGTGRKSKKSGVAAVPITSMMVPVSGTGRKKGGWNLLNSGAVTMPDNMPPWNGQVIYPDGKPAGSGRRRKKGGWSLENSDAMYYGNGRKPLASSHDAMFAFPAGHGAGRPVQALHGGDWSTGLKNVGKNLASKGIDYGLSEAGKYLHGALGAGKKMKRHPALSNRGEIVKQVMREHGMSLPQASAFVKQHGLYAPKMKKGGWNLLNGNSVTLI